ncbi:LysE family transporter [Roseomonas sp. KE2513]|uniref:LysE family translocator n=1 Tax=Roseomonas sp. KE2513 TaxID=2479202 RepID=UPI0018E0012A|nr:LysE family transporter [Roseomonas sp. KE2513]
MSAVISSLLLGAGVGLSIAAPIGPSSLLCIERTLTTGIARGIATGCGVATVHLFYGTLAVAGGIGLAQRWLCMELVPITSGLVLLLFAIRVLRRSAIKAVAPAAPCSLLSSYCGAVGLGFLNPATPLLFAAAAPLLLGRGAVASAPLLIAGVFVGSLGWWCVLSGGISLLRDRVTARILGLMNRVAGLALAGVAVTIIVRSWSG